MKRKKRAFVAEINKVCAFCEYAVPLTAQPDQFLCSYHGIVKESYHCKKFIYDPLKRKPRQLPPMPTLSEDYLIK